MMLVNSTLLICTSLICSDVRMLYFTMEGCPPCSQMEPNVDQMARDGVPVEKINLSFQQQKAVQFQITHTPTVLFVEDNQILMRQTGPLTYNDLRNLLRKSEAMSQSRSAAATPAQPQRQTVSVQQHQAAKATLSPEQRAYQATVRLRVQDDGGMSFATGTVIHRVNNEALVLTCGHVFRDSKGKGVIHADYGFAGSQPKTVTGKLLYYDADKHDVALVAMPCELPIIAVPIAPKSMVMQTGDGVFSLGCNHGDPPTLKRSAMKAVTRYSGIEKYDTVGRPVDGRSGGGLFSQGGQLIGVCNAAAVEVDEGIYASLQSIHWQFDEANLAHLFRSTGSQAQDVLIAQQAAPVFQAQGNVNVSSPEPRAINSSNGAALDQGSVEVIMLVRSKSDPSQVETITISNPDSRMMQLIQQNRSLQTPQSRMANGRNLPDLDPSILNRGTTVRGQSPK